MTPRPLRRAVLLTVVIAALLCTGAAAQDRPNVVRIIGDDYGWPHYGFMGDPLARTPNLDALAAGGTTFRHAQQTSSVCVPSLRAAGGHPHRPLGRRA